MTTIITTWISLRILHSLSSEAYFIIHKQSWKSSFLQFYNQNLLIKNIWYILAMLQEKSNSVEKYRMDRPTVGFFPEKYALLYAYFLYR